MASVENLNDLRMTQLETLLKGCLSERPDIAGRILSSEELSEYVQWMIANYGQSHRYATRDMLPYFTPGNDMTRLAAELTAGQDSKRALHRLSKELAVQNDEGYLAPGQAWPWDACCAISPASGTPPPISRFSTPSPASARSISKMRPSYSGTAPC